MDNKLEKIVPLGRATIAFKTGDSKQAIYTVKSEEESHQAFFSRVGKSVEELLQYETDKIKHVRFSSIVMDGSPTPKTLVKKETVGSDSYNVLTENSRRVLNYWPYCSHCKNPFSFEIDEPFAYCKCGPTEWGDPRPASWIKDPNVKEPA